MHDAFALARRVPFHAPVDSYTVGKGNRVVGINVILSFKRYKLAVFHHEFAQAKKAATFSEISFDTIKIRSVK